MICDLIILLMYVFYFDFPLSTSVMIAKISSQPHLGAMGPGAPALR